MGKKCIVCGNSNSPFFQIPSNWSIRDKWYQILEGFCDLSSLKDHSVLCANHFDSASIIKSSSSKYPQLKLNAVPTIFVTNQPWNVSKRPIKIAQNDLSDQYINTNSEFPTIKKELQYQIKLLKQKLKIRNEKLNSIEKLYPSHTLEALKQIITDADSNHDDKAIFLLDIINNYVRKQPKWTETSIDMCTLWRCSSPKGYRFFNKNLLRMPSYSSMLKHCS